MHLVLPRRACVLVCAHADAFCPAWLYRYAGGLTLNAVYGYHPDTKHDPFLKLANESVDILSNKIASGGGIWLVDIFPFCT